jgi:hypothetical protein
VRTLFVTTRTWAATGCLMAAMAAGPTAAAATLTFDDLPVGTQLADVPGGYGGLSWHFWQVASSPGSQAAEHSGFGVSGVTRSIESAPGSCCVPAPFDFLGADFARGHFGADPTHEAGAVLLRGFRDGELVYSVEAALAETGYTNVAVSFLGIHGLEVQPIHATSFGFGYPAFYMDDFAYEIPGGGGAPIPEPTTLLLLGSGAALVARRRI